MAFTNIGSVSVLAGSIDVTRVISFRQYPRNLLYICTLSCFSLQNGWTLSRIITLIIINNKTNVLFFCLFYELDIWNEYFITNITIYQPDGSETPGLFLLPPPLLKKKKKKKNSAGNFITLLASHWFWGIWVRQWLCTEELNWNDSIIKNYVSSCCNRPSKPELFVPQLDATKCVKDIFDPQLWSSAPAQRCQPRSIG